MKTGIRQETTQDKRELGNKRVELESLKKHLARMERILSILRVETGTLRKMYSEVLEPRIRELDDLNWHLSKSSAFRKNNFSAEKGFQEFSFSHASEKVIKDKPIQNDEHGTGNGTVGSFKDLYRKVAKTIHPDLSSNEEERKWRQKLMAEANSAYAKKDHETLHAILRQWESGPESRADCDIAEELSLIIRKISWIRERIRVVEAEIDELRKSDLYGLLVKVEDAQYEGIDLLAEMAKKIDADIESARGRLRKNNLTESGVPSSGENPNRNDRSIGFPASRSVGVLFVRKSGSESFLDWQSLGEARGEVFIPSGKALRLDVRDRSGDTLDCLKMLDANGLQSLFLHGANDVELSRLQGLTGLQELYLSGKGITDAGLENLRKLKNLHRLYLYDTSVTDNGAGALQLLSGLQCITFCGSAITEKTLRKIKQSLPGCSIIILNQRMGRA